MTTNQQTNLDDHEIEGLIKLIEQLITQAKYRNANFIRLTQVPNQDMNVSFSYSDSTNESFEHFMFVPKQLNNAIVAQLKTMANLDFANNTTPQSGKAELLRYRGDQEAILQLVIQTIPNEHQLENCLVELVA